MQIVNQPVRKKDAMQLVTGQPVYMDDMIPEDCLIVKLLRSPHANAVVQEIQTDKAMKVPGIEASIHGRISTRTDEDLHVQDRLIQNPVHMTV